MPRLSSQFTGAADFWNPTGLVLRKVVQAHPVAVQLFLHARTELPAHCIGRSDHVKIAGPLLVTLNGFTDFVDRPFYRPEGKLDAAMDEAHGSVVGRCGRIVISFRRPIRAVVVEVQTAVKIGKRVGDLLEYVRITLKPAPDRIKNRSPCQHVVAGRRVASRDRMSDSAAAAAKAVRCSREKPSRTCFRGRRSSAVVSAPRR